MNSTNLNYEQKVFLWAIVIFLFFMLIHSSVYARDDFLEVFVNQKVKVSLSRGYIFDSSNCITKLNMESSLWMIEAALPQKITIGDFNGDGLDDFVRIMANGEVKVDLSTCSSFERSVWLSGLSVPVRINR